MPSHLRAAKRFHHNSLLITSQARCLKYLQGHLTEDRLPWAHILSWRRRHSRQTTLQQKCLAVACLHSTPEVRESETETSISQRPTPHFHPHQSDLIPESSTDYRTVWQAGDKHPDQESVEDIPKHSRSTSSLISLTKPHPVYNNRPHALT